MAVGVNGTPPGTDLAPFAPVDRGVVPTPAGAPIAESELTRQLSYSGTPRGPDGITQPDDYVREMSDPVRRMELFEEMRASDDAVATAIDARRQEINAANWLLSTDDKAAQANEILQFCEDNIYPLLDNLLRWLGGGGMQYGFGAVEPVYAWADQSPTATIIRGKIRRARASTSRGLYLIKLAHIRQPSVYTFRISVTGDLERVVQWVYNGAMLRRVEIPGAKLLIWTYDKQGDDHWGVPPTRHCYKAWTFKQQIEKLNLLHTDRFGVGLPVMEEGEGWGEAERTRVAAFLKSWRSGGGNYLLHPTGGKVSVVSDDGKTAMSMLEWVRYYNLQIAKTFLTQQTELGSTETGARALGETFLQQMGGLVQADCEDLASIINEGLVKRLVDLNFGPQKTYPLFTPSQRVTYGGGVGTVLQQLIASGAIHPRPEDEAFLREALNMPPVEVKVLQAEDDARKAATQAAADAAAKQPAPGGAKPGEQTPPAPAPKPVPSSKAASAIRELAAQTLRDGAPPPAIPGVSSYRTREYSQWEQGILRPDVLGRDLDLHANRLTAEVQDVLREIDASLAEQAAAHANDSPETLTAAVRMIAVPAKLVDQLRSVITAAAQRARDYGADAVKAEIERQLAPDGVATRDGSGNGFYWPTASDEGVSPSYYSRIGRAAVRILRMLAALDEPTDAEAISEARGRDLRLAAQVDAAVEAEVARREQSVRSAILSALTQAVTAGAAALAAVVTTAAKAALLGLSTGRTSQNVEGVVNVGFGIGRSDAAATIMEPATGGGSSGLRDSNGDPVGLVAKVYSAVMDFGTCNECSKWDGAEFPIDYPENLTGVQCPNPRCDGTEQRCRCVWIYITDRESVPLVPASKGPIT
jgi:hypothetical protein